MTFGNLSTETLAKLSPQVMTSRGRPTKFTPDFSRLEISWSGERTENRSLRYST
jgi:hypothetical protein